MGTWDMGEYNEWCVDECILSESEFSRYNKRQGDGLAIV
jgi:hypothetical protein